MVKTGLRFRRSDFETLLPRGQVGQFPDLLLGPRNEAKNASFDEFVNRILLLDHVFLVCFTHIKNILLRCKQVPSHCTIIICPAGHWDG